MTQSSSFERWQYPRKRQVLLRLLAVFVLFCSCGTQDRFVSHARFSAHAPRATVQTSSDGLSPRIRGIAHEIAALRGWKDELSVACEYADISRIRQALAAEVRTQTPAAVLRDQTLFLEALGLVPHGFNLETTLLDAFAPEVLGIYSLTWGRIFIAEGNPLASTESVLRHELVHAFQDRLFHLEQRVIWAPNRGDEVAAVHALAEGEAVCIARQLEDPNHQGCLGGNASAEDRIFEREIPNLPPTIRYGLFAPYADGVRLVRRLLRQGGWQRVDVAWSNGPHSTRELFRDSEAALSASDLPTLSPPDAGCTSENSDMLGEQGLASILFDKNGLLAARKSASWLQSDRVTYWRCGDFCAAIWQLRSLTVEGATVLASDLRQALPVDSSVEVSPPTNRAAAVAGRMKLEHNLRDIVITSVHNCFPTAFQIGTPSGS